MKLSLPNSFSVLLFALTFTTSIYGFESYPTEKIREEARKVIKQVKAAYVFIGGGSGAVISSDGIMVTNYHVTEGKKSFRVRLGNRLSCKAKLLGQDPRGDLAVLQLEKEKGPFPYMPLGDSDAVRVGEACIAIGNPFGLGMVDMEPTITLGVVSALHQFKGGYSDAIVVDASINPGNSGGPTVNMKGELIGVNGMVNTRWGLRSNTGLGYAIPANQVRRWLPHLKRADGKTIHHARLSGFSFETDVEKDFVHTTLKAVESGSDADQAGFKAGDVIVTFGTKPVWNAVRFVSLLGTYPAGDTVTVTVKRDGDLKELTFALPELRLGRLGFTLANPKPDDKFLTIGKVKKGSTAANAGLKKGDRIVAINDQVIPPGDILPRFQAWSRFQDMVMADQEIKLRIRRKVKKSIEPVEFDVTITAE